MIQKNKQMRLLCIVGLLWPFLVPGSVISDSPYQEALSFDYTRDVGYGTSVFVVGSCKDLGTWQSTNAVKLYWTPGHNWTGQVAVKAGTELSYKYVWRSTAADRYCDPANITWMPGDNFSNSIPAQPAAPYLGKTLYYYSGWTNASVLYQSGASWYSTNMTRLGEGRTGGEYLYYVDGFSEAGNALEFLPFGQYDSTVYWDHAPYPSPVSEESNYYCSLDVMFLQDGQLYNYWPPHSISGSTFSNRWIDSTVSGISGRTMRVYLPRGYTSNTWKRYPVVYMHDGQNLFGSTGDKWQVDVTADREISQGRMRECIIVGLDNTGSRSAEYMPPGDQYPGADPGIGDRYLQFFSENVIPTVEYHFRALTNRRDTAVMGSSLGGLISLYFAYATNRYGLIGAFSPGLARGTNFTEYLRSETRRDCLIYMDTGTQETDVSGADYWSWPWKGYDIFLQQGYVVNENLLMRIGCEQPHSEWAWAFRLPWAFDFLLTIDKEPNRLAGETYPPSARTLSIDSTNGTARCSFQTLFGWQYTLQQTGSIHTGQWSTVTFTNETHPWYQRSLVAPINNALTVFRLSATPGF